MDIVTLQDHLIFQLYDIIYPQTKECIFAQYRLRDTLTEAQKSENYGIYLTSLNRSDCLRNLPRISEFIHRSIFAKQRR